MTPALSELRLAAQAQTPAAPAAARRPPQGKPEDTEVWEPVPEGRHAGPDGQRAAVGRHRPVRRQEPRSMGLDQGQVAGGMDGRRRRHDGRTRRPATSRRSAASRTTSCTSSGGSRPASPAPDQARGNSGLFLASTGAGDGGYELQILDSYNNKTYVNGQAAASTSRASRSPTPCGKPGEWQTYDVVWTAPTFNADGTVKTPAYVTAFHNGVLVQNHFELKGETLYIGKPDYKKYDTAPIKLQAHGDPSPPISFRNIWVRELP